MDRVYRFVVVVAGVTGVVCGLLGALLLGGLIPLPAAWPAWMVFCLPLLFIVVALLSLLFRSIEGLRVPWPRAQATYSTVAVVVVVITVVYGAIAVPTVQRNDDNTYADKRGRVQSKEDYQRSRRW